MPLRTPSAKPSRFWPPAFHFEPSAFLQLLDIRDHKADRKQFDAKDVFTRYLAAVQHVTAAVDTMLDTSYE